MFAAGGIGAIIFSFLVSRIPKRWGFGRIAIGSQMISGGLVLALGSVPIFEMALVLMVFIAGLGIVFNIQFNSLVHFLVPNQLLGRVTSTILVLAFVSVPIGSLGGGSLIEWTGKVGLVYQVIGILVIVTTIIFTFTPLNRPQNFAPVASKEVAKPL